MMLEEVPITSTGWGGAGATLGPIATRIDLRCEMLGKRKVYTRGPSVTLC